MARVVTAFLWLAWCSLITFAAVSALVAAWAIRDCIVRRRRQSWRRSDSREMRAYQRANSVTSRGGNR